MGEDKITRGKTLAGRLARLDEVLVCWLPDVFAARDGWFVELGFGHSPVTTIETARLLHELGCGLGVMGVEVDPERVARAREAHPEHTWRVGGFELEEQGVKEVRLIRAMNVLRQYDAALAPEAYAAMGRALCQDGALVVGSCDRTGSRLVAHVMRRRGERLWREAMIFLTDFSFGFSPMLFRDWLPQDLRRGVSAEHPFFADFLAEWWGCFESVSAIVAGQPERMRMTGEELARRRGDEEVLVLTREEFSAMIWAPPGGVPGRSESLVRAHHAKMLE